MAFAIYQFKAHLWLSLLISLFFLLTILNPLIVPRSHIRVWSLRSDSLDSTVLYYFYANNHQPFFKYYN